MGLFWGDNIRCDCCNTPTKEPKDVCPKCFDEFMKHQSIEAQVKTKLDADDLRWLDKDMRERNKQEVFNESEYKKQ